MVVFGRQKPPYDPHKLGAYKDENMAFDIAKAYDNKWYKRKYVWMYLAACLMVVAAALVLILGVGNVGGWQRAKGTLHIDGSNISVTYTTLEGNEVTATMHENSISWADGGSIKIRYNTADPQKVQSYSNDITLTICLVVAAAMLVILATSFLGDNRKRYRRLLAASEKGQPYLCTVASVFQDLTAVGPKKKQMYRLECTYVHEGAEGEQQQIWVFMSDRFVNLRGNFGGTVTTYVDPDNPDNYWVDLDTLQIEEVDAPAPAGGESI